MRDCGRAAMLRHEPASATMSGCDLIVVGAGLVGSAIAWGARRAGAEVVLLDEGDIALRAARGNFGLIWLQGKGVGVPPYMHWSQRAGKIWPDLAAELAEATGGGVRRSHGDVRGGGQGGREHECARGGGEGGRERGRPGRRTTW